MPESSITNPLWPALPVAGWSGTRDTVHMWTQIVGKVRLALAPAENHWWNVPLYVDAVGLTTSLMPYDAEAVHKFWISLVSAQEVLSRFRGEFRGKASPVHFFWGAFDLAVTRFSGRPAAPHPGGVPNCPDWVMLEAYSDEVSSCGYWPGGAEEGAFYSYAYPEPPGFSRAAVEPAGARYDTALGEFLLPYRQVRTADRPDEVLLAFLRSSFDAAATLADWPDVSR